MHSKIIQAVLDTPILTEDGSLTEESCFLSREVMNKIKTLEG